MSVVSSSLKPIRALLKAFLCFYLSATFLRRSSWLLLIGILDSVRELLEPELLSLLELELRLGMEDLSGLEEAGGRRHGRELSTGDTDL